MIILLSLLGASLIGIVAGLTYRGFFMIGDRRHLDVLAQQLFAEQRLSAVTHQALADMRSAAAEHFRQQPPA